MRKQVTELTKAFHGPAPCAEFHWIMATWEWNNGWNLISTRRATAEEIAARG